MIHVQIQVSVGQFVVYLFLNTVSGDQPLDLISGGCVRLLNKSSDNIITACVDPIILRRYRRVHFQRMAVAHHIPWTVDSQTAKPITIIPFFYLFIFFHELIIRKHFSDFRVRKAECSVILYIFYRINIQVVQSRKNTLPGDPQTPGKYSKIQASVCFENLTEQSPEQLYHVVVISALVRFVQRHIILIDQHYRLLPIIFVQKARQHQQTFLQKPIRHREFSCIIQLDQLPVLLSLCC